MRLRVYPVVVAAVVLSACKGDATAPPKPASITVSPTSAINGIVSAAVVPPPTFTVIDEKGGALANIAVTVAVTSGGGSVTSAATKSAAGATAVGAWTLGSSPGVNTLTITVAGLAPVILTANAKSAYFVDLRFAGAPIDASFQAAFAAAKVRVEAMITGDVPDTPANALSITDCGVPGVAPLTELVDDLIIYVMVDSIDGPGKVLGSSGPCYVRTVGGLPQGFPLIGTMHFDVADFQNLKNDGRLNDVVLHEMLHVVGIGTMWAVKGQVSGGGTPASAFIGAQAVAGCLAAGGTAVCPGNVPLETGGGQGTRDVHWRESVFRTELMTGFVSAVGIANPLSRMTIGSLGDIGYLVNLSVADFYTVPGTAAIALALIREAQGLDAPFELNDVVRTPIGSVDPKGRVTLISPRIR